MFIHKYTYLLTDLKEFVYVMCDAKTHFSSAKLRNQPGVCNTPAFNM